MLCCPTTAGVLQGLRSLDSLVQLQGDESVGRHHHDTRNQEKHQQQRDVPTTTKFHQNYCTAVSICWL